MKRTLAVALTLGMVSTAAAADSIETSVDTSIDAPANPLENTGAIAADRTEPALDDGAVNHTTSPAAESTPPATNATVATSADRPAFAPISREG